MSRDFSAIESCKGCQLKLEPRLGDISRPYLDVEERDAIAQHLYLLFDKDVPLQVVDKASVLAIGRFVFQQLAAISKRFFEVPKDLIQAPRGRRPFPGSGHTACLRSSDDTGKIIQVLGQRLDVFSELIVTLI